MYTGGFCKRQKRVLGAERIFRPPYVRARCWRNASIDRAHRSGEATLAVSFVTRALFYIGGPYKSVQELT